MWKLPVVQETWWLVGRERRFARMVVISLVIHTVVTVYLATHGGRAGFGPTVTYLDLKMTDPGTSQSKPAPQNVPPVAEKPALPPVETPREPQVPPTEFDKLQNQVQQALNDAAARPEAVNNVSFGLGMANGYFSRQVATWKNDQLILSGFGDPTVVNLRLASVQPFRMPRHGTGEAR